MHIFLGNVGRKILAIIICTLLHLVILDVALTIHDWMFHADDIDITGLAVASIYYFLVTAPICITLSLIVEHLLDNRSMLSNILYVVFIVTTVPSLTVFIDAENIFLIYAFIFSFVFVLIDRLFVLFWLLAKKRIDKHESKI